MSYQRLVINSPLSADQFKSELQLERHSKHNTADSLSSYFHRLAGGAGPSLTSTLISLNVGAVQASATLTVSSTGSVAAQAGSILNVSLTGVASAPSTNEFVVSATPATQAANMAAAINASASFAGKVSASANGAVVTIVSLVPGVIGNGLQISAGNLANVALGAFAAGSDGTLYSLDLN